MRTLAPLRRPPRGCRCRRPRSRPPCPGGTARRDAQRPAHRPQRLGAAGAHPRTGGHRRSAPDLDVARALRFRGRRRRRTASSRRQVLVGATPGALWKRGPAGRSRRGGRVVRRAAGRARAVPRRRSRSDPCARRPGRPALADVTSAEDPLGVLGPVRHDGLRRLRSGSGYVLSLPPPARQRPRRGPQAARCRAARVGGRPPPGAQPAGGAAAVRRPGARVRDGVLRVTFAPYPELWPVGLTATNLTRTRTVCGRSPMAEERRPVGSVAEETARLLDDLWPGPRRRVARPTRGLPDIHRTTRRRRTPRGVRNRARPGHVPEAAHAAAGDGEVCHLCPVCQLLRSCAPCGRRPWTGWPTSPPR